jgi:hypothetical protein
VELILDQELLTFKELSLYFLEGIYKNIFAQKNNKTLAETLKDQRYIKFKVQVESKYSEYLDTKLGVFLLALKERNDDYYLNFLNRNGDQYYSQFKILDKDTINKRGLYLYSINGEIKYIGRSKDPFGKRINQGYGKIHPKNCYIDGQSTNCHLNHLVTTHKEDIKLYVLELTNENEIIEFENKLIKKYKPEWNISLK